MWWLQTQIKDLPISDGFATRCEVRVYPVRRSIMRV